MTGSQVDNEIDRIQDAMRMLELFQSIDEKMSTAVEVLNAQYRILPKSDQRPDPVATSPVNVQGIDDGSV